MEQDIVVHKGTNLYVYREEIQFSTSVQPVCAVIGGGLIFQLPQVQDENALFSDQYGHTGSIRWFSRQDPQLEQANTVLEVVIPELV